MIKGIIFDLDGVYFKNGTKNFLERVSSVYGVEREKVVETYLKSENMQKYKRNVIDSRRYWSWFISELGIEESPEVLLQLLLEGYEVNEEAIKLLKRVRDKGIKVMVCSNNFKERIELLEKKFLFLKDFDFVILSYEHGILKPDLLDVVLSKTGFNGEEVLLIDDGDSIIKEADKKGFQTVLCLDPNKLELYLKEFEV